MISAKWSATSPTVFLADTSGCAFASSTVSGSSGHPGVSATLPACSNTSAHRSQLDGSSQSLLLERRAGFRAGLGHVARALPAFVDPSHTVSAYAARGRRAVATQARRRAR